jgi:prepilin-type N-terminal cleavage/methylation domain-containing protein
MNKINFKKQKGFTLVEVLVATFIMVLMLGAAASVEVTYMRTGTIKKHNFQANELAEEAFNLVRSVRDSHLTDNPTSSSLPTCPTADSSKNPGCFPNQGNTDQSNSYRVTNPNKPSYGFLMYPACPTDPIDRKNPEKLKLCSQQITLPDGTIFYRKIFLYK